MEYKFDENINLRSVHQYIDDTYTQHYAHSKYQATDMIIDAGHGEGFCIGNIMKYAMRYGKKNVGAQLLPCYLRGMTTNYNATAMSFYRDGQYSEIDLTLDMIEFRTLDKEDVRYGWNLYGKNYKDFWEEFWEMIFPENDYDGGA